MDTMDEMPNDNPNGINLRQWKLWVNKVKERHHLRWQCKTTPMTTLKTIPVPGPSDQKGGRRCNLLFNERWLFPSLFLSNERGTDDNPDDKPDDNLWFQPRCQSLFTTPKGHISGRSGSDITPCMSSRPEMWDHIANVSWQSRWQPYDNQDPFSLFAASASESES
jgi:hypothetical protein